MTTLIIACGAALAATVIVAFVFLLARRPRGPGNDELAASIAQIDDRMHAMVRELTEALEKDRRRHAPAARSESSPGQSTSTR